MTVAKFILEILGGAFLVGLIGVFVKEGIIYRFQNKGNKSNGKNNDEENRI